MSSFKIGIGSKHRWIRVLVFAVLTLGGFEVVDIAAAPLSRSHVIAQANVGTLDEANELEQQASQLYQEGRYREAIPLAARALEIRESLLREDHPDIAASLNRLGEIYQAQGNYAEAELLYERSLHTRQTALGGNHPDVALSLNNLASLYRDQRNYGEAEALYLQALQITEATLGENHPQVASILDDLAWVYQVQLNDAEAITLLQRALQIRETAFGEHHPEIVGSLNNLGDLYRFQGNYADAISLFQRALQIDEPVFGENHPFIVGRLVTLASLHQDQGSYAEAKALYQRVLQIVETDLGENHPDVFEHIINLATLLQNQGNDAEAIALLQRALQITEVTLNEGDPQVAEHLLVKLGILYQSQGNYAEAEPLFQRALQIAETTLGENHPGVATFLKILAGMHEAQGNDAEAIPFLQRALQITETTLGENHPEVASILGDLADLYENQGNYSEAETLLQRALQIAETTLGEHPSGVATRLENLAWFYRQQDNDAEAISHLQRALQITVNTSGENNRRVRRMLVTLASWYRDQGNYAEAILYLQRALRITETIYSEYNPLFSSVLEHLATAYQLEGDIRQSLALLRRSLSIEETNITLSLSFGSEARKQDSLRIWTGSTDNIVSLHLQHAFNDTEAAQLAITTVLRRKGRILDAVTASFQRLRQNLSPELAVLLDDYAATQSELSELVYRGSGDQDSDTYQRQIEILQRQSETLENQLAQRSTEFRNETQLVELENIQTLIPSDATLVELVRYQHRSISRYAAYILHPNGNIQWADLGDAATIDQAAFDFLNATQDPRSGNRAHTTARTLDELVMAPIRPLLGNATHLLLSPDSQLNLIPFAALVDEQDRYLIETYTLTHLTTGRDLLRIQNRTPSQQPPVIFANPDYNTAEEVQIAGLTRTSTSPLPAGEGPGVRANDRSVDIASLQFGALPGTQLEVDAIAPMLDDAIVLTEADATENVLKQLQSPRILHMATHGFFLQDVEFAPPTDARDAYVEFSFGGSSAPAIPENQPTSTENPMLRSGLAFAGFNPRQSQGEDGVLTALEAANLDLRGTQLVVMSACETGIGDVANGEGVYGLRRAFVMAGAESQLMSLWKVDDQGTADLMRLYYQRLLAGSDRSEALRQVQLELLNTSSYEHPYYWASFLFSGDWTPMN